MVPSDRHIVVERFRDELGDWRVCVLSPFGGRVHAPWALAVETRMSRALGIEVEAMWSDDGIAIRLPDSDTPPPTELIAIPPDELDDLLVERVSSSPLFAARFRENAARSLLLPRRRPGARTPLWQQRLKAHDLQQVAIRYGSFPVLLETYREVLSDVFEVPRLKELLGRIQAGAVRLAEVESAAPSPFATSLLFDYIASYMYEGDAPAAERRVQALTLDRALLAELLAVDDLRELLDADVIAQVEDELQGIGRTLTADQTHDLLLRLGDLTPAELDARGGHGIEQLLAERRAVEVGIAGERRLIAAEHAGQYRDARRRRAAARPAGGLPEPGGGRPGAGGGALCPPPRAVHGRRTAASAGRRRDPGRARAGRARRASGGRIPARRRRPRAGRPGRAAAACAGARWRRFGTRSSRSTRRRWAASCRPGRGSAATSGGRAGCAR